MFQLITATISIMALAAVCTGSIYAAGSVMSPHPAHVQAEKVFVTSGGF